MGRKERQYIGVNVPLVWKPFLDEVLENSRIKKEMEMKGFTSTYSGLGTYVIKQFLIENTSFRFEHLNTKENHITIVDQKISHVVDVYVDEKGKKLFCEFDKSNDCEHVFFALKIPEVQQTLKRKGWQLDE